MRTFFIIIMMICFFSCKKTEGQVKTESAKTEQDMPRKNRPGEISGADKYFKPGRLALEECDFKTPSKEVFKKKMKEIFKINIDEHEGAKALWLDYYRGEPTKENISASFLAILPERYINYADGMDPDDIIPDQICKFNNMIFYDDVQATNWFKKNAPYAIIDLVKDNGDIKNKNLLKFVFSQSKLIEPQELKEFLFGTYGRGKDYKFPLRKDLLNKMIEYGAELSQLHLVANMVANENQGSYEEDQEELYNYLIAHCYAAGQSGIIEYIYDTNPKIKDVFRKNNYYGVEGLAEYTNEIYLPKDKRFGVGSSDPDPYDGYGVINDPDGYTNMREGKGTNHPVVRKVLEGEKFAIERKENEWWLIVLADGKKGWIHKSRVKIVSE